jgi:hypothetical protein
MATIVTAAVVVLQQSPELLWHRIILKKAAVLSITVANGKRSRCDMFDDPVRVSCTTIVGRDEAGAVGDIGDRAWKAVVEETPRVDDCAWVDWQTGGRSGWRSEDLGGRNGGRGGGSRKSGEGV